MSEHECTEHLYDEIERLRESNFQLRQGAEEQKQRIKRLEEAGDKVIKAMRDEEANYCEWIALAHDAELGWNKAKEAKL